LLREILVPVLRDDVSSAEINFGDPSALIDSEKLGIWQHYMRH
jgi:hypothetical protein